MRFFFLLKTKNQNLLKIIIIFQVVVKEMNRLGMIIDLTSSSSDTQMKVLQVSKAPCMFTSSAAYELANNDKNIKQSVFDAIVRILLYFFQFFVL